MYANEVNHLSSCQVASLNLLTVGRSLFIIKTWLLTLDSVPQTFLFVFQAIHKQLITLQATNDFKLQ